MVELTMRVMEANVMRMEVTEGKKRKLGFLLGKKKKKKKNKKRLGRK